jgi:hypothetical protein
VGVLLIPGSADLAASLSMGCKPLFFSDDGIPWTSYVASQRILPISTVRWPNRTCSALDLDLENFLDGLDTRLHRIWNDLSEFARAANLAAVCQHHLDSELYQETMVSVHYRLIHLRFEMGDANETIRVVLLAFASNPFLQWSGVKTRYESLAQDLKTALSLLDGGNPALPNELTLWLLVVGMISVFNEHEQGTFRAPLAQKLRCLNLRSWNEVQALLKSILWVSLFHDAPAKQIVDSVFHDL